jgi:hypothetical protein
MTPTLRRLNDRERYWGLTWPGWVAAAIGVGVLYGAVRLSPLGTRATVTIVVLASAFAAMVLAGVSGQALSPARQVLAVIAYRRSPKCYAMPITPERRCMVLDSGPTPCSGEAAE